MKFLCGEYGRMPHPPLNVNQNNINGRMKPSCRRKTFKEYTGEEMKPFYRRMTFQEYTEKMKPCCRPWKG
jgi:hypothetical protein